MARKCEMEKLIQDILFFGQEIIPTLELLMSRVFIGMLLGITLSIAYYKKFRSFFIDRYGSIISGAPLCIAAAYWDELTSGLDFATTQNSMSLITSVRDRGGSVVMASHDLDFLTKVSDKIFVLKNGELINELYTKKIKNPINYSKNIY
jgi:hypothetical protein